MGARVLGLPVASEGHSIRFHVAVVVDGAVRLAMIWTCVTRQEVASARSEGLNDCAAQLVVDIDWPLVRPVSWANSSSSVVLSSWGTGPAAAATFGIQPRLNLVTSVRITTAAASFICRISLPSGDRK